MSDSRAKIVAAIAAGALISGAFVGPAAFDVLHGSQSAPAMAAPVVAAPTNLVVPPMPTTTTQDAEKDPYRTSPAQAAAAAAAAAVAAVNPPVVTSPPAPAPAPAPTSPAPTSGGGGTAPVSTIPPAPTSPAPVSTPPTLPAPTTPTTQPTGSGSGTGCTVSMVVTPVNQGAGVDDIANISVITNPTLTGAKLGVMVGTLDDTGQPILELFGPYVTDNSGHSTIQLTLPPSILAIAAANQQPVTIIAEFTDHNVACSTQQALGGPSSA